MKKTMRANLMLLLTALIWGTAFVAQSAASVMPAFAFNAARSILAALALLMVVFISDKKGMSTPFSRMTKQEKKNVIWGGICCGCMLTLGSTFQQLGINMGVKAGKAGFITALYIIIVPVLNLFGGKRCSWKVTLAVLLSIAGLYLLCIKGGFSAEKGDIMLIFGAFSFALHILVINHFSKKTDCLKMSCLQFFVVSVLCAVTSAFFETTDVQSLADCIVAILYAGIMSSAVGYTMQMVAQKHTDPTVASLLMSFESVFAVLAGWLLLNQSLTARELAGCALMMVGIILAQLKENTASIEKNASAGYNKDKEKTA